MAPPSPPIARRGLTVALLAAGPLLATLPASPSAAAEAPRRAVFASTTDTGLVALLATAEGVTRYEIAREMARRDARRFSYLWVPRLAVDDYWDRLGAGLVLARAGDDRGLLVVLEELAVSTAEIQYLRTGGPRSKQDWFVPRQEAHQRRYLAAMTLGQIGDSRAVEPLIEATRDPSISYRAALSLGEIGDPRAIPALREMARQQTSKRHWAGWGLARLGEPDGFDLLIDVAFSDLHWTERRHAIEALGELADPVAVAPLIRLLSDENVHLRVPAARALGQIGDLAALPALRAALDDRERQTENEDVSAGEAAAEAIRRIESGGG